MPRRPTSRSRERSRQRPTRRFGADAEGAQAVGQLVGAGVEGAVGERLMLEHDGAGVGGALDLGFEELREADVGGRGGGGLVPRDEELVALGGGQQGEGREALVGVGDEAGEEGLEVGEEAGDGGGVEEVGAVVGEGAEVGALFEEGEGEVELDGAAVDGQGGDGEAGEGEGGRGGVLEDEEHLEEGGVAEGAGGVERPRPASRRGGPGGQRRRGRRCGRGRGGRGSWGRRRGRCGGRGY